MTRGVSQGGLRYDELYRVTVANVGRSHERRYTYDANGNITNILMPNHAARNKSFIYDDLDRLIRADVPRFQPQGVTRDQYEYSYDLVGNRLSSRVNDQVQTYAYLPGTSLLSGVTGPTLLSFGSDANGNTTAIGDRTLAYDPKNRMIQTTCNGQTALYTYDGLDMRVSKQYQGNTIHYYYDPSGRLMASFDENTGKETDYIYLEDRVVAQVILPEGDYCEGDGDNDGDVDDTDLAGFASQLGRVDCGGGEPCNGDSDGDWDVDGVDLALNASDLGRTDCPKETVYYVDNDHLGTPLRITDANDSAVWEATYAPFGAATVNADLDSVLENNLRFPGQYYDSETGFHYNVFRHYHPGTGRYLTPDPIGLKGGVNVFAYALNDPVNLTDPSGQAVPIAIAIARVAVGAAAGAGGGWVAGKIQGSTVAAVLGGVVGGLAGGLIGLASPEMSSVVGGMIGGAIAGTIGGGLGGYTGKYLADPESSLQERLLSGTKGAGVGVLTGLTIGGISTASILLGAAPWAGDLVGTLAAQPIAIGLGLVPFPWWGSDSKAETLGPSTPYDMMFGGLGTTEEFYVQYQEPNLTIKRDECVSLSVVGGFPPYTWHVEPGSRYFLAAPRFCRALVWGPPDFARDPPQLHRPGGKLLRRPVNQYVEV